MCAGQTLPFAPKARTTITDKQAETVTLRFLGGIFLKIFFLYIHDTSTIYIKVNRQTTLASAYEIALLICFIDESTLNTVTQPNFDSLLN